MAKIKSKSTHVSVVELTSRKMAEEGEDIDDCLLPTTARAQDASFVRLLLLTCGLGGLQVVWSVILSNGSPYLVSLGLSKSLTALIWIAAPICGCVIQPPIGCWSDYCSTRWGRRRPFIFFGTLGIIISLILLAWVREIVGTANDQDDTGNSAVVSTAISLVYVLNIAIQPVQAGIRSLIVDSLSVHQQARASTYATVMQGLGNIFGYLFGFLILPSIGNSKTSLFQRLSIFASIVLSITTALTCLTCQERPLPRSAFQRLGKWTRLFKQTIKVYYEMPSTVRKVCHVQFFSWMAWFPFLYYSTTYVAEFHAGKMELMHSLKSYFLHSGEMVGDMDVADIEARIAEEAIRMGTFASFLFSLVTFIYSMILPRIMKKVQIHQKSTSKARECRIGVVQAWKWSHIYFFLLMLATFFVHSDAQAIAVVALAGLSWALTLFAPFAIIGTELAARNTMDEDASSESENGMSTAQDDQTGAVMGIHNVAISLPQIFAALVCSGIYAANKALGATDGTGWVLKAGGLAALVAALLCKRMED